MDKVKGELADMNGEMAHIKVMAQEAGTKLDTAIECCFMGKVTESIMSVQNTVIVKYQKK